MLHICDENIFFLTFINKIKQFFSDLKYFQFYFKRSCILSAKDSFSDNKDNFA